MKICGVSVASSFVKESKQASVGQGGVVLGTRALVGRRRACQEHEGITFVQVVRWHAMDRVRA